MYRKFIWQLVFTGFFLWGCGAADRRETQHVERPNIIVVVIDDMRWDDYGHGGHSYLSTPNIDRIALEGIRFENAFSVTPLCSPSRASILTGLYTHSHGILENKDRSEQSHQLPTFPATLDSAGYETAYIGKWHMGNDSSPRPGFDYWVCMEGQGSVEDPVLNINGTKTQSKGYVTDILTDLSLDFIKKDRKDPFLLYLAEKALHPNLYQGPDGSLQNIGDGGFVPAPRHKDTYANAIYNRRPNAYVYPADKPALTRKLGDLPPLGKETATPEQVIRDRAEMLLSIDDGIGRIFAALEEKGILDNTVIVLMSDHGYFYGEHGLNEERRLAYEETIRIPLLMRYPKMIEFGSSSPKMVLTIDVAPTLLELGGVTPGAQIDGRSLVPILRGQDIHDWRSSFLVEYYTDKVWPRVVNMGYKAIRTERYKYIEYTDLEGMDELYDLESDPYELNNLFQKESARSIVDELKREKEQILR